MGQKPITFIRQVLQCVSYPKALESPDIPADVKQQARDILASCGGNSTGEIPLYPRFIYEISIISFYRSLLSIHRN